MFFLCVIDTWSIIVKSRCSFIEEIVKVYYILIYGRVAERASVNNGRI